MGIFDRFVFTSSPISRPLQTTIGVLLPFFREILATPEVQSIHPGRKFTIHIHPYLRERQMEGDSSMINFLHDRERTPEEKLQLFKQRHKQSLNFRTYGGWEDIINLDYSRLKEALEQGWSDGYETRKGGVLTPFLKQEPRHLYEKNSVQKFLKFAKSKTKERKVVIAGCHGHATKVALHLLGCKTVHPESFHVGNLDAFGVHLDEKGVPQSMGETQFFNLVRGPEGVSSDSVTKKNDN